MKNQTKKEIVSLKQLRTGGLTFMAILILFLAWIGWVNGSIDKDLQSRRDEMIESCPVIETFNEEEIKEVEEKKEEVKEEVKPDVSKMSVENQIRHYAQEENFQWEDYLVRLAKCESKLNPKARGVNKDGSIDRGTFQINNSWHREVTDAQAYDVEFSTKWTMKMINAGQQTIWACDKLIK